jgi:hypothetical protein
LYPQARSQAIVVVNVSPPDVRPRRVVTDRAERHARGDADPAKADGRGDQHRDRPLDAAYAGGGAPESRGVHQPTTAAPTTAHSTIHATASTTSTATVRDWRSVGAVAAAALPCTAIRAR